MLWACTLEAVTCIYFFKQLVLAIQLFCSLGFYCKISRIYLNRKIDTSLIPLKIRHTPYTEFQVVGIMRYLLLLALNWRHSATCSGLKDLIHNNTLVKGTPRSWLHSSCCALANYIISTYKADHRKLTRNTRLISR